MPVWRAARAAAFDPARVELDRILSWNGVEASVHTAPRGCPAHDLSLDLARHLVSRFVDRMPVVVTAGKAGAGASARLQLVGLRRLGWMRTRTRMRGRTEGTRPTR